MNDEKDVKGFGGLSDQVEKNTNLILEQRSESKVALEAIKNYETNQEKVVGRHYLQFGAFNAVTDYSMLKQALKRAEKFKTDPMAFKSPVDLLNALQRK